VIIRGHLDFSITISGSAVGPMVASGWRWLWLLVAARALSCRGYGLNFSTFREEIDLKGRRVLWTGQEEDIQKNQRIFNSAADKAIDEIFGAFNYTFSPTLVQQSRKLGTVDGICSSTVEPRLACCEPTDSKYLHNVRFAAGKMYVHVDGPPKKSRRKLRNQKGPSLPDIVSVQNRAKMTFNVEMVEQSGPFREAACSSFFNGTLHVNGRVTAHNVYHALADNVVPLAHQIMLDAVLYPEMLHLPRMGLVDFPGHPRHELMSHLQIASDLMSAGMHDLKSLEGHCFRRVVWGYGAHLMYSDTLVFMRRLVSEFLRQFVILKYPVKLPAAFTAPHLSAPIGSKFSQLKIVLYTRGSSGQGRSMQHEDHLVQALAKDGAQVASCCDFSKASMVDQISYAVYADVVWC
jgi:hypothetical protein